MSNISQLADLGLFDARAPRYTSYPPANHFKNVVTPAHYRDWIAAIPEGSSISLYLHVPFCRRLCWFCACRTQGTKSDSPVRSYVQTLLDEIALLGEILPRDVTLSRLHWGGGTPTLIEPGLMEKLAAAIFRRMPLAEGGEFSVEIDPNEIDEPRMDALARAGLTRASIGVQDFDPAIQAMIGREQSFEITASTIAMIRDRGIRSVNADILFGLPGQDGPRIADSVQKLMALGPDRIALYGYAHVPWVAKRQVMIPADKLPDPRQRLALFEIARSLLVSDGYDEIGIDHFARPDDGLAVAQRTGRLRRNFQGYTDDQADVLIGLGASSISRFPQGYAQNAPATGAHVGAIRDGRFSTMRGHVMTPDDQWRARMIEAVMCDFRIDTDEFVRKFGLDRETVAGMYSRIAAQFGDMVTITARGLSLDERARPLTRMIAQVLDAYDMGNQAHSTAI